MTVKNLDSGLTFHFVNLPEFVTEWVFEKGVLVGKVFRKGVSHHSFVCELPVGK